MYPNKFETEIGCFPFFWYELKRQTRHGREREAERMRAMESIVLMSIRWGCFTFHFLQHFFFRVRLRWETTAKERETYPFSWIRLSIWLYSFIWFSPLFVAYGCLVHFCANNINIKSNKEREREWVSEKKPTEYSTLGHFLRFLLSLSFTRSSRSRSCHQESERKEKTPRMNDEEYQVAAAETAEKKLE